MNSLDATNAYKSADPGQAGTPAKNPGTTNSRLSTPAHRVAPQPSTAEAELSHSDFASRDSKAASTPAKKPASANSRLSTPAPANQGGSHPPIRKDERDPVVLHSPNREGKNAEGIGSPAPLPAGSPLEQQPPPSSPEKEPEKEPEVCLDVKSKTAWGQDVAKALEDQAAQNRIRLEWLQFLESSEATGFPRETPFLLDSNTQPNTQADLEALKSLDKFLKAASLHQKSQSTSAPDRFEALFAAYKEHTPAVILRGGALRTVKTLEALLKAGITPEQLHRACFMSFVRDVGAQLTTSTAAYTGSFFTYNALLSHLIRDEADPSVQLTLPPLAHTAASLVVARFLRAAEMGPGWTRAVEADSKGATSAAILTKSGFAKTVAQYWPFFAPLLWASLATPDPVDAHSAAEKLDRSAGRVEFRRDWGFAASEGVALHRIFAFKREHVWLDASTEPKRLAMLAAIDELTSPLKTMTSLGKYAVVRPLAGLAGLVGWDAHPVINKASEWLWGVDSKNQSLTAGTESVGISGYLQKKGLSIKRAGLLGLPMGMFNTARSFTNSAPGYSDLINVANDAILIGVWGYAMAVQERSIATDDNLKKENVARATRQTMALARRARDVAPS